MSRDPSRTEAPTPRRLNKARQEGSVAKSQELAKAVVLLAALVGLKYLITPIASHMTALFRWFFKEGLSFTATEDSVYALMLTISAKLALMLLPFMAVVMLAGYLVMRLQVGSLWAPKVFQMRFDRLFNFGNIKQMFNPQAFIRLGRSLLQAIVVGLAPYVILKREVDNILPLFYQTTESIAAYILTSTWTMVLYALVPMTLIGVADLWYSRWKYTEDMRMTKDEVKDERRQAEGDQTVKMRQRQKMMEVMARRMMQQIPKADIIVTNPTHYAVALRYDAQEAPAPVVLAKGVDNLALKIREKAREHGIPIRENRALARALYDQVEIGEAIPETLYQAVAAMLAQLQKFSRPGS